MAEVEDTANVRFQLELVSKETLFLKKYFALRRRCEQLQQSNEKIVNRIHHVKKLIRRYQREKRYLSNCLDERGDNYKEAQVPLMWEEDQLYGNLRTPGFFQGRGSESETDIRGKYEHNPSLLSVQPLLQARGMGNLDTTKLRKEHNEEITHHELTKSLAQQWNALVPEEKRIYYEMYEREKERYKREMRSYKSNPDSECASSAITN